jgi:hypothetical protein
VGRLVATNACRQARLLIALSACGGSAPASVHPPPPAMNATSTVYYNDVAYQLVVQYTAADAANAANLIIDGQAIPPQPGQPYLGASQPA